MTEYALKPLGDQIIVRLRPLPAMTGVIHRVDINRQETARIGDVQAVGPLVLDKRIVPNACVLLSTLIGQAIGDELLVPESSILGFLGP